MSSEEESKNIKESNKGKKAKVNYFLDIYFYFFRKEKLMKILTMVESLIPILQKEVHQKNRILIMN